MPRYYCDYCKSYLTHDTMSVRKLHLTGRNHIRYYCNYYENKAKEHNLWDASEEREVSASWLLRDAPGPDTPSKLDDHFILPPPPHIPGGPLPPTFVNLAVVYAKSGYSVGKVN